MMWHDPSEILKEQFHSFHHFAIARCQSYITPKSSSNPPGLHLLPHVTEIAPSTTSGFENVPYSPKQCPGYARLNSNFDQLALYPAKIWSYTSTFYHFEGFSARGFIGLFHSPAKKIERLRSIGGWFVLPVVVLGIIEFFRREKGKS